MAEAILRKRVVRNLASSKYDPKGLLSIRGEDFTETSEIGVAGVHEVRKHEFTYANTPSSVIDALSLSPLYAPPASIITAQLKVQRVIRSRIVKHLEMCSGYGVIVFDEVQKIGPGALEVRVSDCE